MRSAQPGEAMRSAQPGEAMRSAQSGEAMRSAQPGDLEFSLLLGRHLTRWTGECRRG
jgi:hypothetical protein